MTPISRTKNAFMKVLEPRRLFGDEKKKWGGELQAEGLSDKCNNIR